MPIYEFYCRPCHTVFSFFSARVDTSAHPSCPRCGQRQLPRKPSTFATIKRTGDDEPDPLDGIDESRLEGAMESLMQEVETIGDEEDPRAMGRLMRRFGELTGLEMGDRMEEVIRRLESGEDPEALEEEMDGAFGEGEEDLDDLFKLKKAVAARRRRPAVDEQLYFL